LLDFERVTERSKIIQPSFNSRFKDQEESSYCGFRGLGGFVPSVRPIHSRASLVKGLITGGHTGQLAALSEVQNCPNLPPQSCTEQYIFIKPMDRLFYVYRREPTTAD
jgi:hypothetical protein